MSFLLHFQEMYLNSFKATEKASQPFTVLCIEVYLIDELSSAFLASRCFVILCFVFSQYVAQFWKCSAFKKGFSIDWDYFCSSQGTFNTQEWIQLKAFSVQRIQTVQDHFILYWILFHLTPFTIYCGLPTGMEHGDHWRLTARIRKRIKMKPIGGKRDHDKIKL